MTDAERLERALADDHYFAHHEAELASPLRDEVRRLRERLWISNARVAALRAALEERPAR